MVQFREGNLLDLPRIAQGQWDIVFCRNTFMYFTPAAATRLFTQLRAAMARGGFLFLGHAETLRGVSDAFDLRHSHDAFFYVLDGAESATSPLRSSPPERTVPAAVVPEPTDDAWFHEIARATERIAALVDGGQPRATERPLAVTTPGRSCATCVADALALLAQDRHQAALDALGGGTEPERLLLRAVLLVNLGRLEEARAACAAVLAADSLHAGAYYVKALCAEKEHDDRDAARHDEMASYLDDTFAMPQLHLAMLARRRGDRAVARRHMERARELFVGEDDLRILMFGGGFSRQSLIQMCDTQLRTLAS
jgi:chemotaxis protein methyltransferase CheR